MRAELYFGAVPHPEHVERYETLLPGSTDRFITMAERQSAHRQRMESRFIAVNGTSQVLGSLFAGLTVLGALAAGTFLVYHDKNIQGLTAMLAPLAIIGGIFLKTRKSQGVEIERKREAERR